MNEVHIRALINEYGSTEYLLFDNGITHPLIVLPRGQLEQLRSNIDEALKVGDLLALRLAPLRPADEKKS